MSKSVIVVAGGRGTRIKSEFPKQFIDIQGFPILMHTISVFYKYDKSIKIIVVLPSNQFEFWEMLCAKYRFTVAHQLVAGGSARFFSVQNGLRYADTELIAIHDGVRPFVSVSTVEQCFAAASQYGAAVPVVEVTESIRVVELDESRAVERNNYRLVQTPQIFRSEIIQNAYKQNFKEAFTDDASVVESAGHKIFLTQGNPENIKITRPVDLKIAETLLGNTVAL
ncbi:MAG: 2-C-methyl-D-erythritol 4-phosphate cytidylyltransferase [Prevotellaceae bacterium]|jgi:2-C-methyl-D-erythritol 4-phosphate cytidylyltransferase|nr:2-C-methyl-D-erythritol 4-phosphate cytidylyltransferase [Prevotellaceae bacterium]